MESYENARGRIDRFRVRIVEEEERRASVARLGATIDPIELELEMERVLSDLQEYRDQLDANRKRLEQLHDDLRDIQDDADELRSLTSSEQEQWAEGLLGGTIEHQRAERLIALQSEWADRFGTTRGFLRPLIERSSTVAGTCIGLASIEEASDVEFDLCIIDEGSKATAMECCVPMARAKRGVLIGDSKQLPTFQEEVLARPELGEALPTAFHAQGCRTQSREAVNLR